MSETNDRELPEVTDAQLEQALGTTRPYTIVVLKAGPRFSSPGPGRSSEVEEIIWEHGKRNLALRSSGLMPIVCPVADGSDITGICIFDADAEEVGRIMSRDPGVNAGVFTYEVHPAHSFPGSALPMEH
jgi:hypothetical protein